MSETTRFDYDEGDIHRTYASGRALSVTQRRLWSDVMREEAGGSAPARVLDLDRPLRAHARGGGGGSRRARHLILMFLVYHHLADRLAVLRECARVLVDGAPLVIVTSTVETLDGQTWLPFFPSARPIDLARIPARADLLGAARATGLAARHRVVLNPVAAGLRAYAERVATRTISTLQLVPDEEFARGIAAFRRHCEKADDGRPVQDEIDVFTLRAGRRQGPLTLPSPHWGEGWGEGAFSPAG